MLWRDTGLGQGYLPHVTRWWLLWGIAGHYQVCLPCMIGGGYFGETPVRADGVESIGGCPTWGKWCWKGRWNVTTGFHQHWARETKRGQEKWHISTLKFLHKIFMDPCPSSTCLKINKSPSPITHYKLLPLSCPFKSSFSVLWSRGSSGVEALYIMEAYVLGVDPQSTVVLSCLR